MELKREPWGLLFCCLVRNVDDSKLMIRVFLESKLIFNILSSELKMWVFFGCKSLDDLVFKCGCPCGDPHFRDLPSSFGMWNVDLLFVICVLALTISFKLRSFKVTVEDDHFPFDDFSTAFWS